MRLPLKGKQGFTLIELMAVIAIIALLSAVSLPALKNITTVSGKKGAISMTLGIFSQARSLAISQGQPVYIAFTDYSAAEKYRNRALAIYQKTEGSSNIVAVSRWNFLPEGTAFRSEPQSLFGSTKMLDFPVPRELSSGGGTTANLKYIEFDETGAVAIPTQTDQLNLYIFEGYVAEEGKEVFTSRAGQVAEEGKAALYFDEIRISPYTGMARWTPPESVVAANAAY